MHQHEVAAVAASTHGTIESRSRRIKRVVVLGACAVALVAPVSGSSFTFAAHNFRHGYGARWSPNGKHLAFVGQRGHGSQPLEVVNANGIGFVNLTGKWFVAPHPPAWSPRGAKLAFVRMTNVSRPNETFSLWTIDTATRVKKRLAVSAVEFDLDSQLAWTPNGSRIALSRLDEVGRNYRIYTVKANGGGLRGLTEGRRPDWSPDGRTIVFDTGTGLPGFVPGGRGGQRRWKRPEAARQLGYPTEVLARWQANRLRPRRCNLDDERGRKRSEAVDPGVALRLRVGLVAERALDRLPPWHPTSAIRDEPRRERPAAAGTIERLGTRSRLVSRRKTDQFRALYVGRLPHL